jgi:hypothetical protein
MPLWFHLTLGRFRLICQADDLCRPAFGAELKTSLIGRPGRE